PSASAPRYESDVNRNCIPLDPLDNASSEFWLERGKTYTRPPNAPPRVLHLRKNPWITWPVWFQQGYALPWSTTAISNIMHEVRAAVRNTFRHCHAEFIAMFSSSSIRRLLRLILGRSVDKHNGAKAARRKRSFSALYARLADAVEHVTTAPVRAKM